MLSEILYSCTVVSAFRLNFGSTSTGLSKTMLVDDKRNRLSLNVAEPAMSPILPNKIRRSVVPFSETSPCTSTSARSFLMTDRIRVSNSGVGKFFA